MDTRSRSGRPAPRRLEQTAEAVRAADSVQVAGCRRLVPPRRRLRTLPGLHLQSEAVRQAPEEHGGVGVRESTLSLGRQVHSLHAVMAVPGELSIIETRAVHDDRELADDPLIGVVVGDRATKEGASTARQLELVVSTSAQGVA